jgi:hypothetical protein
MYFLFILLCAFVFILVCISWIFLPSLLFVIVIPKNYFLFFKCCLNNILILLPTYHIPSSTVLIAFFALCFLISPGFLYSPSFNEKHSLSYGLCVDWATRSGPQLRSMPLFWSVSPVRLVLVLCWGSFFLLPLTILQLTASVASRPNILPL